MEDREIVSLYWRREERAIAETDKKYGRYCHYIAYRILNDDGGAEETVNDTWFKTWNTVPPNRPDPLKHYVGMLSRQLAIDRYEHQSAEKRRCPVTLVLDELAECLPDGNGEELGESLALQDALNRFLHT
ncbi:MAG: RNA polymerase subunit sigma-70, partial [Clostridia bacterium]|nr:RNA polymerase subunit sigma-70 [Clostridia bacterium]